MQNNKSRDSSALLPGHGFRLPSALSILKTSSKRLYMPLTLPAFLPY
jgi:hypothetical protein